MKSFLNALRELRRYPSSTVALVIILGLVLVSVYAMITIPYSEAIRLWRGGEDVWYRNPRNAPPMWMNWFSSRKQPVSFSLSSTDEGEAVKTVTVNDKGNNEILVTYTFDYTYDDFPQEMIFYFTAQYAEKNPFVSVTWITPDGRETGWTRDPDWGFRRPG